MTCRRVGAAIVCGPSQIKVVSAESIGIKWCFVCREHVEFTDTLKIDAEPSYYGPWVTRECARGHQDGDLFPGRYRGWDFS